MTGTVFVWGILPAAIALAAMWGSMLAYQRTRSSGYLLVTGFIFASTGSSLLVLYRIFVGGAHPTYLPHIMIAVSAIVSIIQVLRARRR